MGIPARFSIYKFAAHGLIPRNQIFKCSGLNVMKPRSRIGRWWPFKKHKRLAALSRFLHLLKDFFTTPILKHLLLELIKVNFRIYRFKHFRSIVAEFTHSVSSRV